MNAETSTQVFDVREAIADISSKLLSGHPQLPLLLRKVHSALKQDPDIVTILTNEERAIIIRGLEVQTKVKLVEIATPKKSKSLKSMTVDDI